MQNLGKNPRMIQNLDRMMMNKRQGRLLSWASLLQHTFCCNPYHGLKRQSCRNNFGNRRKNSGENELVPNELLRYTDVFDDPNLSGVIEVTVKLKAVSCGTDLSVTQAGVPAVIPEEACYLGWQDSLRHLARLVEGGPPAEEGSA